MHNDSFESKPLIEAKGISHAYEGKAVFKDVHLTLDPGKIVVLMGPNGAGKSTLVKALAGVMPNNGSISYNPLLRFPLDLAYMDQDAWNAIFPWQTVRQNIEYPLHRIGWTTGDIKKRTKELLDAFELTLLADRFPKSLSGGQRQRLALCRTIAWRPRCLFLDEAFSAMDPTTRRSLLEVFIKMWKTERFGALLVTHNPVEAVTLAQEIWVMCGSPATITSRTNIENDYPRNPLSPELKTIETKLLSEIENGYF